MISAIAWRLKQRSGLAARRGKACSVKTTREKAKDATWLDPKSGGKRGGRDGTNRLWCGRGAEVLVFLLWGWRGVVSALGEDVLKE